jgi:hypothetical protein
MVCFTGAVGVVDAAAGAPPASSRATSAGKIFARLLMSQPPREATNAARLGKPIMSVNRRLAEWMAL